MGPRVKSACQESASRHEQAMVCISNHVIPCLVFSNSREDSSKSKGAGPEESGKLSQSIYLFRQVLAKAESGRILRPDAILGKHILIFFFWRQRLTYRHGWLCWNCLFFCVLRPRNESIEGRWGDRMSQAMFAVAVTQNTTALGRCRSIPWIGSQSFPITHPPSCWRSVSFCWGLQEMVCIKIV